MSKIKMLKLEMPTLKEVLEETKGNEQLLEEQLDRLRLWLKQQLHLPQDVSEERLRFYIYSAKFDLEKTKKRLDLHYTLRNLIPEFYSNRDPLLESVTQPTTYLKWVALPKLTPENYRISILRFLHADSSVVDFYAAFKYVYMIMETRIEEDLVNNEIMIYDAANLTFGHILKYTPAMLKKFDTVLEAYGLRIKAIYIINAPNYIDVFLTMIKSAMKTKLFNRIHTYTSGIESLYDIIPKALLPIDYGGEELSTDTLAEMWQAKLMERRKWFLEQEKVTANESLRTNSVINPDDLFGVPGTFRKFNID